MPASPPRAPKALPARNIADDTPTADRLMTSPTPPDSDGPPPYFDVLLARIAENDPTTLAAFGRHLHWGYWDDPASADGTAEDFAAAAERLCQRVCDAAELADGMRVLDCGCGFGGTIASLNQRLSGCRFVGVNIDPRQLARAREIVVPTGGNRVEFVEADACELPLAADEFDAVLAVECVFHFPSRRRFFEQVARVLRPGGRLSLSDFIPPARVLPYLESSFDPLRDPATRNSYGHVDVHCTTELYRELGAAVGLELDHDEDMTPHTLPTYAFLRSHMEGWHNARLAEDYDQATARLQKVSAKGLLQYKTLAFEAA